MKPALLADAYEAVVAAIYLDGGLDAARGFVLRSLVEGAISAEAEALGRTDHKSALQELLQSRGTAPGTYHIVEELGPDHEKTFRVEVRISGEISASGTGRTKKEAEQAAAVAALRQLDPGEDGKDRKPCLRPRRLLRRSALPEKRRRCVPRRFGNISSRCWSR